MTQINNPCDYLEQVYQIAADAGRRILDIYERGFEVEEKPDHSPLTAADSAAHALITERLQELTPGVPVLSEESAQVKYGARREWRQFWLVDPLDGTKEFINRNGEFTVNIALIDGHAPVLGVVYVPVTANAYLACAGGGAHKQQGACARTRIAVRAHPGERPIVVASRSHAGPETQAFLAAIGPHDVVSMGSALKFCLVAEGTADVYPRLGPTMEWDTAAAQCVVEQAGGRVLDAHGRPLTYNKESLRNPWFVVVGGGTRDWLRYVPTPR